MLNEELMRRGGAEDRLALLESEHRVRNEIAAALAALHLVRAAPEGPARERLLDRAVARLHGFGAMHVALGARVRPTVALEVELAVVCRALVAGRACADALVLDVRPMPVDGEVARDLLLVAAELVANAIRHALGAGGRTLMVSLRGVGSDGVLEVADDGPGMVPGARTAGTGLGGGIVRELVDRIGGRLEVDASDGTRARVVFPLARAAADGAA